MKGSLRYFAVACVAAIGIAGSPMGTAYAEPDDSVVTTVPAPPPADSAPAGTSDGFGGSDSGGSGYVPPVDAGTPPAGGSEPAPGLPAAPLPAAPAPAPIPEPVAGPAPAEPAPVIEQPAPPAPPVPPAPQAPAQQEVVEEEPAVEEEVVVEKPNETVAPTSSAPLPERQTTTTTTQDTVTPGATESTPEPSVTEGSGSSTDSSAESSAAASTTESAPKTTEPAETAGEESSEGGTSSGTSGDEPANTEETTRSAESSAEDTTTTESSVAETSTESTTDSETTSAEPTAPPEPEPAVDENGQPESTTPAVAEEDRLDVAPFVPEGTDATKVESVQPESEEAVKKAEQSVPESASSQLPQSDVGEVLEAIKLASSTRNGNPDNWKDRDRNERPWDQKVRHWDWVKYDDRRRPIVYNPCWEPIRILFYVDSRPIVRVIPRGGSLLIDFDLRGVIPFAAFNLYGGLALGVSGGHFYAGGWAGAHHVPPPIVQYNNTVVVFQQTNIFYAPVRVEKVVVIEDCRRGRPQPCEPCVLINGTHRAWGSWQTGKGGNRYFLANRSETLPAVAEAQVRGNIVAGPSPTLIDELKIRPAGSEQDLKGQAAALAAAQEALKASEDTKNLFMVIALVLGVGAVLAAVSYPFWGRRRS